MSNPAEEWASSAALNAALKYRPQLEGLADLKRQAEERFSSSVAAGRSEGTLASQAAQGAVAPTQQIFQQAQAEAGRSRALTAPGLASLGATNPFVLAAGNEQAAGGERLANTQAHAMSDLQARKVAAGELPAFAQQAAMAQLIKDLTSVNAKRQSLQGAEGATVQSEIDRQRAEAGKAALTERGQNLTRESAREGHQVTERGQNLAQQRAEGAKPLSPKDQAVGGATIRTILNLAKSGYEHGESRAELVARLTKGRSAQTIGVNSKGEPIGEGEKAVQHVKLGALPAYKPDTLMSAALDVAEQGHVSLHYQHQLEAEGYDLHRLGLPLAPAKGSTAQKVEAGVGNAGKRVSRAISGL